MIWTTQPRSDLGGHKAIVTGQGRPIVLFHGVGLRAEAWAAQIADLQADYQIIAPDMPGHGAAPCPPVPMPLAGYAQNLARVLEALEEPALIVGHSMGALIALELASHRPDRVCGVAALNAVFQRNPAAAAAVRARAESLTGDSLPDPDPTLTRWFGASDTPERRACDQWLRSADPRGYKWAYSAFAQTLGPEPRDLRAIACPVLFATGADEPNSTPEMSQQMAQETPDSQALIIEGAAHMLPMTHPDTINAALRRLAARVWPAPSGPRPDTVERN